jgi:hypothetical protein
MNEVLPFDREETEMNETPVNWFHTLNGLNVNEKVEKKNGFSYLSWAWAHARMAELDPDFDWFPVEFNGLPYLQMPGGCMVKVTVRFQGRERSHLFPILDYKNKPIQEPSSFDVNTSIMRGFVKCVALFGLGLYLYAGEDLPEVEVDAKRRAEIESYAKKWSWTLDQDKQEEDLAADCFALHEELTDKGPEFYVAVSELMDSKARSAHKAYIKIHKKGTHHAV